MRSCRKPIDHFRTAHFLRPPPSIKIPIAMKGQAMLLDPHVTHLHFLHELVDRHPLRALERIENLEPLRPADLCYEALIHRFETREKLREERLYAGIFNTAIPKIHANSGATGNYVTRGISSTSTQRMEDRQSLPGKPNPRHLPARRH